MSIPPSPERTIPLTANLRYQPLKLLGDGKDGDVVLAIPRSGVQNLGLCIALKILKGNNTTSVPRSRFRTLKNMQNNGNHLIAAVRDYVEIDHPEWHCMSYIPGYSIEHLLEKTYCEHGMPPTLVFHVFAEIVRAQDHLRINNLTHTDLSAGGNVMLSNKDNDAWPSATLVDFSGILAYDQRKEIRHAVQLTARMTKSEETISEHWRSPNLQKDDIEAASEIYKMIRLRAFKKRDNGHLAGLWKGCSQKVELLKQSLKDDVALEDLRKILDGAKTTDADVQRLLVDPEIRMDVLSFDAAWAPENS